MVPAKMSSCKRFEFQQCTVKLRPTHTYSQKDTSCHQRTNCLNVHAIRNAIRAPSCLLYLIGPKRRNWLTHISRPNLRMLDATYYPKVICSYHVADLKYGIDELVWLSRCSQLLLPSLILRMLALSGKCWLTLALQVYIISQKHPTSM
jgi:hypothetical protein